jgi:hypothetical protein
MVTPKTGTTNNVTIELLSSLGTGTNRIAYQTGVTATHLEDGLELLWQRGDRVKITCSVTATNHRYVVQRSAE